MASNASSLLGCFSCRRYLQNSPKKSQIKQNGGSHQDGITLSSELECCNGGNHTIKVNGESVRDTASSSVTSQIPAFGDPASGSLSGWSNAHVLDGADVSKINFISSLDSSIGYKPAGASVDSVEPDSNCLERLESLINRLERLAGIPHEEKSDKAGLFAFQSLVTDSLPLYMALSSEFGLPIKKQSQHVLEAFHLIQDMIELSIIYSKPSQSVLEEYYKPLSYKIAEIADYDTCSTNSLFRYGLVAVADSAVALAWCNCPTSSIFVREIRDATNAFVNRTYQYCSSHHTRYAEWIRSWMSCLKGLQDVVDEHFSHGLSWNRNGPRPPSPPKISSPSLKFSGTKAPLVTADVCSVSKAHPTAPPVIDEKCLRMAACGDVHAVFLVDILKTRHRLRHVSQPDFM